MAGKKYYHDAACCWLLLTTRLVLRALPRGGRAPSTTGTRRGLVAHFDEFSVDTVPIADARTMGNRWENGPGDGDRWHPDGACVRFRFTLGSGSYATVLLREFIQGPLANM